MHRERAAPLHDRPGCNGPDRGKAWLPIAIGMTMVRTRRAARAHRRQDLIRRENRPTCRPSDQARGPTRLRRPSIDRRTNGKAWKPTAIGLMRPRGRWGRLSRRCEDLLHREVRLNPRPSAPAQGQCLAGAPACDRTRRGKARMPITIGLTNRRDPWPGLSHRRQNLMHRENRGQRPLSAPTQGQRPAAAPGFNGRGRCEARTPIRCGRWPARSGHHQDRMRRENRTRPRRPGPRPAVRRRHHPASHRMSDGGKTRHPRACPGDQGFQQCRDWSPGQARG